MCLILFSWKQDENYPLVLAANRDEFYQRPTLRAHWWEGKSNIFAGRDLKGGGTWMGINKKGYWAALTNYREIPGYIADAPSRGSLVSDFLEKSPDPQSYLLDLSQSAHKYNGFNLLVSDGQALWYFANRGGDGPQKLAPGLYGLSNHLIDTDWPKISLGKSMLQKALVEELTLESLFELLGNDRLAADKDLPQTGVSLEWERLLSAMYIRSKEYGTRVSTVLIQNEVGNIHFEERAYVPEGMPVRINFQPESFVS